MSNKRQAYLALIAGAILGSTTSDYQPVKTEKSKYHYLLTEFQKIREKRSSLSKSEQNNIIKRVNKLIEAGELKITNSHD